MIERAGRHEWSAVAACLAASLLVNKIGLWFGRTFVTAGAGYTNAPDLFRFDAKYYLDIATTGYAYDGNPSSSPNIVFAPGFPWLVRAVPFVDPVTAGFGLNLLLLTAGIFLMRRVLAAEFEPRVAFWATLAQVTSAGSYAFHAFYSESTMFFGLAVALYAHQRRRDGMVALAAAGLGATRLTAIPVVLVFAAGFVRRVYRRELSVPRGIGLTLSSLAGAAGFLSYLAVRFGNPFVVLPEIQGTSWGLFHPPTAWAKVFTGLYLIEYARAAARHAVDIRTFNLTWVVLSLASLGWLARRRVARPFFAVFAAYVLFYYAADASSEFLISAHRFAALVTPIFAGGACLGLGRPRIPARILGSVLLTLNICLSIWHTGCFNQGVWFYF